MELLDIVDENNQLTGQIEDRKIVHEKGLWHREVCVWIMNEKGEILVQKRAASKKTHPNYWGLTAGHVDSREEPIQAAVREAKEEIGLELQEDELEPLLISKQSQNSDHKINNYFTYHYLARTNRKIENYVLQEEELSEVKYMTLEELEGIRKQKRNDFTFTRKHYTDEIFSIFRKKIQENLK